MVTAKSLSLGRILCSDHKSHLPPYWWVPSTLKGKGLYRTCTLGRGIWRSSQDSTCHLEFIPGAHGCLDPPFQDKPEPCFLGGARAESMGPLHLHCPLDWAQLPPTSPFWPWVSISDERFHGKRVTFLSKVDLLIGLGECFQIISVSPPPIVVDSQDAVVHFIY